MAKTYQQHRNEIKEKDKKIKNWKQQKIDPTDNCYLDWNEEGELVCLYNHKAGEDCLACRCQYCNEMNCICYN